MQRYNGFLLKGKNFPFTDARSQRPALPTLPVRSMAGLFDAKIAQAEAAS
jgi:hypothetical protein